MGGDVASDCRDLRSQICRKMHAQTDTANTNYNQKLGWRTHWPPSLKFPSHFKSFRFILWKPVSRHVHGIRPDCCVKAGSVLDRETYLDGALLSAGSEQVRFERVPAHRVDISLVGPPHHNGAFFPLVRLITARERRGPRQIPYPKGAVRPSGCKNIPLCRRPSETLNPPPMTP